MKDFDDWVIKPYRLDDLLGKIQHVVMLQMSHEEPLDQQGRRSASKVGGKLK